MSVGKTELVQSIAGKTNVPQARVDQILNATLSEIRVSLERDEPVVLRGFGTFKVQERAARTGRNPRTGESIRIPASKVVSFKSSK